MANQGAMGGGVAWGGLELVDLHSAAKQDDIMAIVRLLKEGANVDKRDPYGYTPLHWACQKGHTHTVQALLAAGANVHVRDKWRRTPLHRAAKEGHKETVEALLDSGAEINAQGDSNWTPLHCSSFHGKLEIVEMLLNHGADQSAKDLRGRTSAAVCDMGLYDVDQSVKTKIMQLLENAPTRLRIEAPAPAHQASTLTASIATNTDGVASAGTDGGEAITPAAASAAAAAAAAHAASAASLGSSGDLVAIRSENTFDTAMAAASAASAASAADNGVFALWGSSLSGGGVSDAGMAAAGAGGSGGIVENTWTDAEDAAWHEMWAMLHVPDPDDPDNNLYTEVKTLRKDVRRLRDDLNDTASYEGIFGDSATAASTTAGALDSSSSTAGATASAASAAAVTVADTDGISANSGAVRHLHATAALSKSGQETFERSSNTATPAAVGGSDPSLTPPPPAKRQKSKDRGKPAVAVSEGVSLSVVAVVGGGGGGGEGSGDGVRAGQEAVAVMGEKELREQVVRQNQLLADMALELERLKRDRSADASGAARGSREVSDVDSLLPVLDERALANKVR